MKKIIAGFCLSFFASFSSATVINFDDLSGDPYESLSDGYQGFNWLTLASINKNDYPDTGYAAGTVSGNNAAFNQYAADVSISLSSVGTVDFIGAFFTAAWIGDYFHEISFEGFLDGVSIYSLDSAIALANDSPLWIQLNWTGIDQLNIYSNLAGWDQWVMDDFTVAINSTSVPEPSAFVLVLMGVLGIGVLRYHRATKKQH